MMLTAMTGEKITAGQLLGEEKMDARSKEKQANREHRKFERKLRKRGIGQGKAIAVADSGTVFNGEL